jgi:hypothetical protein
MVGNAALSEGDTVCFTLESIYLPGAREVIASLLPADQMVGTILQFSESDAGVLAFAVIALAGQTKVVVPVEKLARVGGGSSQGGHS